MRISDWSSDVCSSDLSADHSVASGTGTGTSTETGGGSPEVPATIRTIQDTDHTYHLADTSETRASLVRLLEKQQAFCFDTETTGTDANNCELVGLSFCIKQGEAWYVPVPPDPEEAGRILNKFTPVLENPQIDKIGQNIKFDKIGRAHV